MRTTTFIYALICPIDNTVKYVGKSNDPVRRLKDHMLDFRDMDINKATWISTLKRQKLRPLLEVVDEVGISEWQFWEEFWIGYYKSIGARLFNRRSGNGLTYASSTTFKKGNIPWNRGVRRSIDFSTTISSEKEK